jgi:prevent-host-death family protein
MKTIPAKKLQTNLEAVLQSSQKERILISRDGKPCAVLVGVEDYDAEDLRMATSPDFSRMIRQRRSQGKSIPLAEVQSRLAGKGMKSPGVRASGRKKPRSG